MTNEVNHERIVSMVLDARRKRIAMLQEQNRLRWDFDRRPTLPNQVALRSVSIGIMQLEEFIVNPQIEGLPDLGIEG